MQTALAEVRRSGFCTLLPGSRAFRRGTAKQHLVNLLFSRCFSLSDSQDEDVAGPTARAPQSARVPARSVDRHFCCSRSGDHGGSDRDLQLRIACDRGALRRPVDDHD